MQQDSLKDMKIKEKEKHQYHSRDTKSNNNSLRINDLNELSEIKY